jgi:hypothetical protein
MACALCLVRQHLFLCPRHHVKTHPRVLDEGTASSYGGQLRKFSVSGVGQSIEGLGFGQAAKTFSP